MIRFISIAAVVFFLVVALLVVFTVFNNGISQHPLQIISWWAGSLGFCVLLFSAVGGVITLWSSLSANRAKIIIDMYDRFLDDDAHALYIRICEGGTINWKGEDENEWKGKDEHSLNKCLTLFDGINYLRTQGWFSLLCTERSWEYIAYELQCFAANPSVWAYIEFRFDKAKAHKTIKRIPDDIIPFTGFPELLSKIPLPYQAENFPCVPAEYVTFYNHLICH